MQPYRGTLGSPVRHSIERINKSDIVHGTAPVTDCDAGETSGLALIRFHNGRSNKGYIRFIGPIAVTKIDRVNIALNGCCQSEPGSRVNLCEGEPPGAVGFGP